VPVSEPDEVQRPEHGREKLDGPDDGLDSRADGGDLDPEGSKNLGGDTDDTTETAQDEDDRRDRARVLPKPRRHSRERLAEQLERRDETGCGLRGKLG